MDNQTQKKISYATLRGPHWPRTVSPCLSNLQTSGHGITFNFDIDYYTSPNLSPTKHQYLARSTRYKLLPSMFVVCNILPIFLSLPNCNHATVPSLIRHLRLSGVLRDGQTSGHDGNKQTGLSTYSSYSLRRCTKDPHRHDWLTLCQLGIFRDNLTRMSTSHLDWVMLADCSHARIY